MPGLFIRRQAEMLTQECDVAVLYVHEDKDAVNRYEIDSAIEHDVNVVRVYYRIPLKQIPALTWLIRTFRFFRAHMLGFSLLRTFHPDLIHVHVLTREGLFARFIRSFIGIPYVITEHWSRYLPESNGFHGSLRKYLTRVVVRNASAVMPVSEILKKAMLGFGLKNHNYRVVPNPVDTSLFTMRETARPEGRSRFIHISCFEDKPKNISGFLTAVKQLSDRRDDFECYLIGDGPEFDVMKKKAGELGILDSTAFFTGLKTQEELVKIIKEADFLVLSSNYETFGTVVIECLSCGIPVVATRVGIVPEVINESNGIIIPTGDVAALADAINRMLDNYKSYDKITIRNSIKDRFGNETVSKQLLEIYQKTLNIK
jgi:glycosyltransferase involved in cell wall biosynthesis